MTSEMFLEDLIRLSKEDQVEKLASLFFAPEDIAFFVGLNPEEFKRRIKFSPEDALVIAYRKGVMETEIKLRFDTHRYALSGSPEAINSMKDYLSKMKISEMINGILITNKNKKNPTTNPISATHQK